MAIERILLPTDFSELSMRAARTARELAQVSGATVHVIHVWRLVEIALPTPEVGVLLRKVPPDQAALQIAVDEFALRYLAAPGVSIVTVLREGEPVREIVRYAKAERIDRIVIGRVVGTHACGILRRLLHGSVSKSVMENAPCAVAMVPPAVALSSANDGDRDMQPVFTTAS